jgi:REP element-mobilizing transposase RayT
VDAALDEDDTLRLMPKGQRRVYGKGELHFITSVCYQRQPKLAEEKHRALFLQLLEQIAAKFRFEVQGVAVLPDRFHLLMTEPAEDTADNAVDMLRHRYGRRYNSSARTDEQVWETKWTDAHVVGAEAIEARLEFLRKAMALSAEPEQAPLTRDM